VQLKDGNRDVVERREFYAGLRLDLMRLREDNRADREVIELNTRFLGSEAVRDQSEDGKDKNASTGSRRDLH
jgi:hypothetical protein